MIVTIRKFRIANILLFIATILCLVVYDIFGGLWLKGFTSFWFVALGATNLYFAGSVPSPTENFRAGFSPV
jgi:hypothetical protein